MSNLNFFEKNLFTSNTHFVDFRPVYFMNLKFRRKDTPPEFPDVVTWAAWLYYIDQMTQIDVAKAIGVSRASVVNYLQEARERGLVSIHFDQKSISETVISKSLQEKYGLSSCLVIPKTIQKSIYLRDWGLRLQGFYSAC